MNLCSLNYNQSYQLTLYRGVNSKIRYYKLLLYPTLFNEYLFIREYGGNKNKKPTRVIKKYFTEINEATIAVNAIINSKIKRGYATQARQRNIK